MLVVVIIRKEYSVPSVVGPFATIEQALGFGNTIARVVDGVVKITEMEPVPSEYA